MLMEMGLVFSFVMVSNDTPFSYFQRELWYLLIMTLQTVIVGNNIKLMKVLIHAYLSLENSECRMQWKFNYNDVKLYFGYA